MSDLETEVVYIDCGESIAYYTKQSYEAKFQQPLLLETEDNVLLKTLEDKSHDRRLQEFNSDQKEYEQFSPVKLNIKSNEGLKKNSSGDDCMYEAFSPVDMDAYKLMHEPIDADCDEKYCEDLSVEKTNDQDTGVVYEETAEITGATPSIKQCRERIEQCIKLIDVRQVIVNDHDSETDESDSNECQSLSKQLSNIDIDCLFNEQASLKTPDNIVQFEKDGKTIDYDVNLSSEDHNLNMNETSDGEILSPATNLESKENTECSPETLRVNTSGISIDNLSPRFFSTQVQMAKIFENYDSSDDDVETQLSDPNDKENSSVLIHIDEQVQNHKFSPVSHETYDSFGIHKNTNQKIYEQRFGSSKESFELCAKRRKVLEPVHDNGENIVTGQMLLPYKQIKSKEYTRRRRKVQKYGYNDYVDNFGDFDEYDNFEESVDESDEFVPESEVDYESSSEEDQPASKPRRNFSKNASKKSKPNSYSDQKSVSVAISNYHRENIVSGSNSKSSLMKSLSTPAVESADRSEKVPNKLPRNHGVEKESKNNLIIKTLCKDKLSEKLLLNAFSDPLENENVSSSKPTDEKGYQDVSLNQRVAKSKDGGTNYYSTHFCIYCKTFQSRLDRHLFIEHKNKPEVDVIDKMPKGSLERKRAFAQIRKKGDAFYNKDRTLNPNGNIIGVRRDQDEEAKKERKRKREREKSLERGDPEKRLSDSMKVNQIGDLVVQLADPEKTKESEVDTEANEQFSDANAKQTQTKETKNDKIINQVVSLNKDEQGEKKAKPKSKPPLSRVECPVCHGYYTYNNLRNHVRLMHCDYSDMNTHQILTESKKEMKLCHPRASDKVRTAILPKLKFDSVGTVARYDLTCILYANKYVIRYQDIDQQPYIRGHIRLLAKLYLAIKGLDPSVPDLASAFIPRLWPIMLKAINLVCQLDTETNQFKIIYNAETLPMLIRKCIKILKREYIVHEHSDLKLKIIYRFEGLFEDDVEFGVSYLANLSRKDYIRNSRPKGKPTFKDTYTFENYLTLKREVSLRSFAKGEGDEIHYLNILQTTAALLLLYNRRRPGEISKVKITDFKNRKAADVSDEFFQQLTSTEKAQRLKFSRIDFQGKRCDGEGGMYSSEANTAALNFIVENREKYGVHSDNPYLFGLPAQTSKEHNHVKLGIVISALSLECAKKYKAIEDKNMRATQLRKQLACANATMKNQLDREILSRHMGHSLIVHNGTYRSYIDKEDVRITNYLDAVRKAGAHRLASAELPGTEENVPLETMSHNQEEENSESFEVMQSLDELTSSKGQTIGQGTIRKPRWLVEETQLLHEAFSDEIASTTYPSTDKIQKILSDEKYALLANKSPPKIISKMQSIFRQLKKGTDSTRKINRRKKYQYDDSD